MSRRFDLITVFVLSFLLAGLAFAGDTHAKDPDRHLTTDPARALYARSAFAHGYIHGYEEGFHCADLDLQMARDFRDVKANDHYKKINDYKKQFGSRQLFEQGYRTGFRVGYVDSYSGRRFRGETVLIQAAKGEAPLPVADKHPAKPFDEAFMAGYNDGRNQGLHDGRMPVLARNLTVECEPAEVKGNCDAFRRGYQVGYSDGFDNQREDEPAVAKKQKIMRGVN